jgi:hypothetical protein
MFLFAILGKTFWPKRQEVEDCRKLQNEELYNLYASQCVTRVITSKETQMVGAYDTYKTEDKRRRKGTAWKT